MPARSHLVTAGAFLALASAAHANLFTNGSLNGPSNTFSLVPTGWSNLPQGTTDTVSTAGHPFGTGAFAGIGNIPFPSSPNGGTFAWSADFFQPNPSQPEGLRQTVSGLTVGDTYTIAFEYTNLGLYNAAGNIATTAFSVQNFASSGRWLVDVSGVRIAETPAEDFAQLAGTQTWRTFSVDFVASATSHEFRFTADWVSGGTHVGMGIDGLSLTVVPSPTSALTLAASAGLLARRRR